MPSSRTQRPPVRKWTSEEEEILLDEIGRNPINLRMCFVATATVIHRTPGACASHWYYYLSKNPQKYKTGIITIGRHAAIRNRKRYKEGVPITEVREGIFHHLLDLLFGSSENV